MPDNTSSQLDRFVRLGDFEFYADRNTMQNWRNLDQLVDEAEEMKFVVEGATKFITDSQPPRPRVMHEVLLARAAVKRSQGRPRAKY